MIYDNEYATEHAERIVKQYGHDRDELIKQISGELVRFHRLGQMSIINPVANALKKGGQSLP